MPCSSTAAHTLAVRCTPQKARLTLEDKITASYQVAWGSLCAHIGLYVIAWLCLGSLEMVSHRRIWQAWFSWQTEEIQTSLRHLNNVHLLGACDEGGISALGRGCKWDKIAYVCTRGFSAWHVSQTLTLHHHTPLFKNSTSKHAFMGLRSAIAKIPVLAVATVEDTRTSPAQRQDCHVESPMGEGLLSYWTFT